MSQVIFTDFEASAPTDMGNHPSMDWSHARRSVLLGDLVVC